MTQPLDVPGAGEALALLAAVIGLVWCGWGVLRLTWQLWRGRGGRR